MRSAVAISERVATEAGQLGERLIQGVEFYMNIESLVYKAEDIAIMLKCSKSKAYNIINDLNKILVKEKKIEKISVISGRISKKEFDRIYGNLIESMERRI